MWWMGKALTGGERRVRQRGAAVFEKSNPRVGKKRFSLPVTCMSNYSGQSAVLRNVYIRDWVVP